MTHRILLEHLRQVLRPARLGRYAAVTRPDAAFRRTQPSYCYVLWSLANRSSLARQLTGTEPHHVG